MLTSRKETESDQKHIEAEGRAARLRYGSHRKYFISANPQLRIID